MPINSQKVIDFILFGLVIIVFPLLIPILGDQYARRYRCKTIFYD